MKRSDNFTEEPIWCLGGGMLYTIDMVSEIYWEDENWMWDDVQALLRSYVAGYKNLIYHGSVALHKTGSKGGVKQSFNKIEHKHPDRNYFHLEYDDLMRPSFPTSRHLTPYAHRLHNHYRGERFGL
jgi:GT2 family glycosyltransferase